MSLGYNSFANVDQPHSALVNRLGQIQGGTGSSGLPSNYRFTQDLIPLTTSIYNIGSSTNKWQDIWVSRNAEIGGNVHALTLVVDSTSTFGGPLQATNAPNIGSNAAPFGRITAKSINITGADGLNNSISGTSTFTGDVVIQGQTTATQIIKAGAGLPDVGTSGVRFGTGYFTNLNISGSIIGGTYTPAALTGDLIPQNDNVYVIGHNTAAGDSELKRWNKIEVGTGNSRFDGTVNLTSSSAQFSGSAITFAAPYTQISNTLYGDLFLPAGSSKSIGSNAARWTQIWGSYMDLANATGSVVIGSSSLLSQGGTNGVVIGQGAGGALNSGCTGSVFIGYLAGANDTTGNTSTFVGYTAGQANTTAVNSVYIGSGAGQYMNATNNVAIGYNACNGISGAQTGGQNVCVGTSAGIRITSGNSNTCIGFDSCFYNLTTGSNYACLGTDSCLYASHGTGQTAIGSGALRGDTVYGFVGGYNTAIGMHAGFVVKGASNNFLGGYECGRSLNDGNNNVLIGYQAAVNATTATGNVAIGYQAASSLTSGGLNVAVGEFAMYSNSTGSQYTCVGYGAGSNLTHTTASTAVGYNCLAGIGGTTANTNTGVGIQAGENVNGSASGNCVFGYQTGQNLSNGSNSNNYIGLQCAQYQKGSLNTAIGWQAFRGAAVGAYAGTDNICIGYQAGYALNGAGNPYSAQMNVIIGNNAATLMAGTGYQGTACNNVIVGDHAARHLTANTRGCGIYNTIVGSGCMTMGTNYSNVVCFGAPIDCIDDTVDPSGSVCIGSGWALQGQNTVCLGSNYGQGKYSLPARSFALGVDPANIIASSASATQNFWLKCYVNGALMYIPIYTPSGGGSGSGGFSFLGLSGEDWMQQIAVSIITDIISTAVVEAIFI